MRTVSAILAAVALLACGCATQLKTEPVKLEVLPDFSVAYSGGLNRNVNTELPEYTQPEAKSDTAYMLEVRIIRCDSAQAEDVFGARSRSVGAWTMDAAELDGRRIAALNLTSAPRLSVMEGQSGTITILNQVAYISGFELSGKESTRIADPVIDVMQEGIVLGLRAQSSDEKRMDLSLDLALVDLVKPIQTQEISLGGAPVTIQTPVVYTQRMKGQGNVAESKVLVLTGMADREDGVYIVLITGKRMDLSEKPAIPEATPDDPEEK